MIRILHAADLHLDSPFEGLSGEKAALRRAEQRTLLERMAELCAENAVGLVLLSGDLFDGAGIYQETTETLSRALARIAAPVFIAPGNHDFYGRNSRWARMTLPENVRIFREPRITGFDLPELSVRVWGAGFADSVCVPGLLRDFRAEKRPGILDILCLHGEVGNPASRYNPVSEDELARSGMDYAALGHVHAFSGLRRAGSCFYAWPGCAEGRGFDETGEKGVILAQVDRGVTDLRFVPLGGRRYALLPVDAGESEDLTETVLRALPDDAARNTYRIILTGECETAPDLGGLRRALEGRVFGLQLRDETHLRRDVWERAREDSLRGVFLRKLRERYDAAGSDEEKNKITMAARWGLAALDGSEEGKSV